MLFSPHLGDPEQARLMSDLRILIKAEGQSSIWGWQRPPRGVRCMGISPSSPTPTG